MPLLRHRFLLVRPSPLRIVLLVTRRSPRHPRPLRRRSSPPHRRHLLILLLLPTLKRPLRRLRGVRLHGRPVFRHRTLSQLPQRPPHIPPRSRLSSRALPLDSLSQLVRGSRALRLLVHPLLLLLLLIRAKLLLTPRLRLRLPLPRRPRLLQPSLLSSLPLLLRAAIFFRFCRTFAVHFAFLLEFARGGTLVGLFLARGSFEGAHAAGIGWCRGARASPGLGRGGAEAGLGGWRRGHALVLRL